jgi:hypothetical protein
LRIAAREQRHDMPPLRGHHQLLAISLLVRVRILAVLVPLVPDSCCHLIRVCNKFLAGRTVHFGVGD